MCCRLGANYAPGNDITEQVAWRRWLPRKKGGKKHVSQKHLCEQLLMAKKTERSTLGVLYTGYLEKFNPDGWTEKAKRRFVVLTHVGLHWFKVGCGASSHFSGQRCRRSAADGPHGKHGFVSASDGSARCAAWWGRGSKATTCSARRRATCWCRRCGAWTRTPAAPHSSTSRPQTRTGQRRGSMPFSHPTRLSANNFWVSGIAF